MYHKSASANPSNRRKTGASTPYLWRANIYLIKRRRCMQLRCLKSEGASAHSSKSPPRAAQARESQTTPQSRRVHASCMHVRIKNSKGGGSVHSRCLQREGASAHSSKSPPRAAQACESQTTPQSRRVHASCMHVRIKNSKGLGACIFRCFF